MRYVLLIILLLALPARSFDLISVFSLSNDYSNNISFSIENDFPFGTDKYYTHSNSIGFLSNQIYEDRVFNFELSQNIVTPHDRKSKVKLSDDMPYSGSLILKAQTLFEFLLPVMFIETQIGMMGKKAYGKETQEFLHSFAPNSKNPEGWHNQLNDDLILNFGVYSFLPVFETGFFGENYRTPDAYLTVYKLSLAGLLEGKINCGTYKNDVNLTFSTILYSNKTPKYMPFYLKISNNFRYVISDAEITGIGVLNEANGIEGNRLNSFMNVFEAEFLFMYKSAGFKLYTISRSSPVKHSTAHSVFGMSLLYSF